LQQRREASPQGRFFEHGSHGHELSPVA
jgi:hypothetical protein